MLHRCWCLRELQLAIEYEKPVRIALLPAEAMAFRAKVKPNFLSISTTMVALVDSSAAVASRDDDKQRIMGDIMASVGFAKLDLLVLGLLHNWLRRAAGFYPLSVAASQSEAKAAVDKLASIRAFHGGGAVVRQPGGILQVGGTNIVIGGTDERRYLPEAQSCSSSSSSSSGSGSSSNNDDSADGTTKKSSSRGVERKSDKKKLKREAHNVDPYAPMELSSTIPLEKGLVESGRLPRGESCRVHGDYSWFGVQSDISGSIMHKFYSGQVIQQGDHYYAWARWGRSGEPGQSSLEGPMSEAAAVQRFEAKFKDKTGHTWAGHQGHYPDAKKGKYKVVLEGSCDSGE